LANIFQKGIDIIKDVLRPNTGLPVPHTDNVATTYYNDFNDTTWFETNGQNVVKSYKTCPPLNAIINDLSTSFSNGKITAVNAKTLKPLINANRFENIIKYPNPLQSMRQFMTQVDALVTMYGYCAVLKDTLIGSEDILTESNVNQMWILPNQFLEITTNDKYLYSNSIADMIDKIEFKVGNKKVTINKQDVYFFTDLTTSIDDLIFPTSRLTALKYPINNIIKNFESQGVIIESRGALGILSNVNAGNNNIVPLSPDEKSELQNDYKSSYGLRKGASQIIITNANLQFQKLSLPIKELMLLELLESDIKSLCYALSFPFNLTPYGAETTFDNQERAEKRLYNNTIIPKANNFIEQLNDCLGMDSTNVKYNIDYSHLPCMQDNKKEEAEVHKIKIEAFVKQFVSNLITYDAVLKELKQDNTSVEKLFFWQMPAEFQDSFKKGMQSNSNESNNNTSNDKK
jgi:Phage portal protein